MSSPSLKRLAVRAAQRAIRQLTDRVDVFVGIAGPVTYNEDGLVTEHLASFLEDDRFRRAYEVGRATGSWEGRDDIRWRCHVCFWAAAHASRLDGDFVECGVYRGGRSLAVCEYVDFGRLGKKFWLLDTYSGMKLDQLTERERQIGRVNYQQYTDTYEYVRQIFSHLPVEVVRGPVPETLPRVTTEQVAYLHVDMNAAVPEIAALEYFWPRLVRGAIVIADDYGWFGYEDQHDAWDRFAGDRGTEVLALPTGQGILIKR